MPSVRSTGTRLQSPAWLSPKPRSAWISYTRNKQWILPLAVLVARQTQNNGFSTIPNVGWVHKSAIPEVTLDLA